jgi:hypothetical protein
MAIKGVILMMLIGFLSRGLRNYSKFGSYKSREKASFGFVWVYETKWHVGPCAGVGTATPKPFGL